MQGPSRREVFAMSAAATAAAALPAGAARAQGAEAGSAPGPLSPAFRYSVGEIAVWPVYDGMRGFPLQDGFVTNASLDEVRGAFETAMRGTETIENPFTPTLIRSGDRLVLIDTGNGPQEGESPVGRLVDNLAAAGIAPGDIDMVVISHFHGDHISGLRDASGAPMFPNAELLVPEGEVAYWLDEGEMSRAPEGRRAGFERATSLFDGLERRPYAGGDELAPGIVAVDAHGHAPGHMAFRVQSGSEGLLLISDAAHLPFLIREAIPNVGSPFRHGYPDMSAGEPRRRLARRGRRAGRTGL